MKLKESLDELIILTELGFEKYPKGWDRSSVKKFADTITKDVGKDPDDKGWFNAWVKKIGDHVSDPERFCASVRDEFFGHTKWRGKEKKKSEVPKPR